MNVKPEELANVCAIFLTLRTDRTRCDQLESYVANCLLLHSSASPTRIIEECNIYGLLQRKGNEFLLTDRGRQLGNGQRMVSTELTEAAREFLLKSIYLDTTRMPMSCQALLLQFDVDVMNGTFVYERSTNEQPEVSKWLRVFYRVGLIEIDDQKVFIRPGCLGLFNSFLTQVRGTEPSSEESWAGEGEEVGKFAEERAIQYEVERLRTNGHPDLALLIQQISLIDRSAGYDLISRKGTGDRPEETFFIEVKGTTKPHVSFIWSPNERRIAAQEGKNYWIYVFTHVDLATKTARGPVRIFNPVRRLQSLGYVQEPMDVLVYRN